MRESDDAGGAVVGAVVAAVHLHGEVASGPKFVNDDGDIEDLRREALPIILVPPVCKARVGEVRQAHRPGAVHVAGRSGD